MRTVILLVSGLLLTGLVQEQMGLPTEALAQVGSSISADGTPPNNNAMLDVQSPATGAGKGILIPRLTQAQRTTASASLDGGLVDNSGNLRGGAAQGLIVYQTDGSQGLYFNTSQTAAPAWVYLGSSTTNYLPLTGGTMSGALNMGAQIVSNVAYIDFSGDDVAVGRGANVLTESVAVGGSANGTSEGAALGFNAQGYSSGAAMGWNAKGYNNGVALGWAANGAVTGVAVGASANGYNNGVAVGRSANGYDHGAAMGNQANGTNYGAVIGYSANGSEAGAAVGWLANGSSNGVAIGGSAKGTNYGVAVGSAATGSYYGVAVGRLANGRDSGVAIGYSANGNYYSVAVGWDANGSGQGAAVGTQARGINVGTVVGAYANANDYGIAMGYLANGVGTNVAIGVEANAQGGTNRIAIGYRTTNTLNNTAVLRGTLYLDGGTGVNVRATFGTGTWSNKAFEINHPLDPENKILRHYCLEGPQVWNVYAGNAQLVNGQAVVLLPDYYSALNLVGSEIYSLTPIGTDRRATAVIEQEVANNCFVIGGSSDIKVSWTIKVLRNDPGCREDLRRRPVEQYKSEIGN